MRPSVYSIYRTGSGLHPYGICTDALSHILVCDGRTNTVHMLDENGKFLSLLQISGMSLSYDFNTHRLWVGTETANYIYVHIYRYIDQHNVMTGKSYYIQVQMTVLFSYPKIR